MTKGNNIQKALENLQGVKENIFEIEALLKAATGEEVPVDFPEYKRNRIKVLEAVEKEGGVIAKDKLHAVAIKAGFDTRGLGGFFTRDKSLVQIAGNKVAITDSGKERLKEFKELLEAFESQ